MDGRARPSLVVTRDAAGKLDAARFAAQQLGELRHSVPGLRVVREGPARCAGVEGQLREQTFSHGGALFGQLQLFLVHEGRAYTLTFTHAADRLDAVRPQAEALFGSIQLETPPGS